MKVAEITKTGMAIHRYQMAGHVTVVMPKSDAKSDMGRNRVATAERKAELLVWSAFVMLNSNSMRLLKPAHSQHRPVI